MIRPLKKYEEGELAGCHEFNHLIVINLDHFIKSYPHSIDCYSSPFKILFDLEMEVRYHHQPEQSIDIPYAEGLTAKFELREIALNEGKRIVEYEFISLSE